MNVILENPERAVYYDKLQNEANERVRLSMFQLEDDPKFHELDRQTRVLISKIAQAEFSHCTEHAEDLRRELKRLQAQKSNRMMILGISPADLKPAYKCKQCNDTGVRLTDSTPCDCYPFSD